MGNARGGVSDLCPDPCRAHQELLVAEKKQLDKPTYAEYNLTIKW